LLLFFKKSRKTMRINGIKIALIVSPINLKVYIHS